MATGRKTVVVGQVIDPDTWGNLVWDQSVQQFASDADRTAQFPTGSRRLGAVTWLDDVKRLDVWDGTTWQPVRYDTGWITTGIAFAAGWSAAAAVTGWRSLAYRQIDNEVRLNGVISKNASWAANETMLTMPVAVRPTGVFIGQGDFVCDIGSLPGIVRVRPPGAAAATFGVDITWWLG